MMLNFKGFLEFSEVFRPAALLDWKRSYPKQQYILFGFL